MSGPDSILVVSGDFVQAALIRATLEAADLAVEIRDDGHAALRDFNALAPAVLILDVNLSEPNALEVLRLLPETASPRGLKILGLIMPGEADLAERCRALGVDDFLSAPFDPKHLVEAVYGLLPESQEANG